LRSHARGAAAYCNCSATDKPWLRAMRQNEHPWQRKLPRQTALLRCQEHSLTPCVTRARPYEQHFTKEDGFARTRADIDALLLEPARLWAGVAASGGAPAPAHALEALWARLDEVIQASA
jgi:hypothetical protein